MEEEPHRGKTRNITEPDRQRPTDVGQRSVRAHGHRSVMHVAAALICPLLRSRVNRLNEPLAQPPCVLAEQHAAEFREPSVGASSSARRINSRSTIVSASTFVPWARIGELVGQRNLAVTANTYTHVLADEAELAYAEMLTYAPQRVLPGGVRIGRGRRRCDIRDLRRRTESQVRC